MRYLVKKHIRMEIYSEKNGKINFQFIESDLVLKNLIGAH